MIKGWSKTTEKRPVAVLVLVAFFVLLDHCSLAALADVPNSTIGSHIATTHEEPCHHSPRNKSHSEGSNDDCAQMSCCTNIKAEIAAKDIFLTLTDRRNFQPFNDITKFLMGDHDNLPQPVSDYDVGSPGFFYQVPFYYSAFASQAPPQA